MLKLGYKASAEQFAPTKLLDFAVQAEAVRSLAGTYATALPPQTSDAELAAMPITTRTRAVRFTHPARKRPGPYGRVARYGGVALPP